MHLPLQVSHRNKFIWTHQCLHC